MKDFVITKQRQLIELGILLACFVAAFSFNVYSITYYEAPWSELFTMLPFICLITLILYAIILFFQLVVRAIIFLLFLPFKGKNDN